jgi:hypothetical protein
VIGSTLSHLGFSPWTTRAATLPDMWCPVCGSEYQPGFTRCPDCDVALAADAPTGPLAGLPDRALSSSWPFIETWMFPQDPGAVFERVIAAMAALRWRVTATDLGDRVVGGSIGSSFKHVEAEDVEIDVVVQPEGGSLVRVRAHPKLGHDMGMCRADATRLISEIERTLGPSQPAKPSPA